MKRQLIILAGILLLSACSRKESITPTEACTVAPAPLHSKGTAFQEIITDYTRKGLPGIALLVKMPKVPGTAFPVKPILQKGYLCSLAMSIKWPASPKYLWGHLLSNW